MDEIILENLLNSILIKNKVINIDDQAFTITGMIGQGYHKQVFAIDDEQRNKVIKIVRKDAKNITSAFLSFKQAIENQNVLEGLKINYTRITSFDKNKFYYRYLIQEKIPDNGVSVTKLIKDNKLKETDICQIAEIVNKLEKDKKWQLDMSPFNWFSLNEKIIYTGGTVYNYDEDWSFDKIGLWQWIDPVFTSNTTDQSTKIPTENDKDRLAKFWKDQTDQKIEWWKRYLSANVQPKVAA